MLSNHEMLKEVLAFLFTSEYRRLGEWINRLVRQNQEAYGDPDLASFVYSGVVYKRTDSTLGNKVLKRRGLHPTLNDQMDAYVKDLKILTDDEAFIRQSLFKLIDPCRTSQDLRDTLPECLADSLDCIRGLNRTGEEGFTLMSDERAWRQYQKVLPRIELYVATRMIY